MPENRCIYCLEPKPNSRFNREHVLPQAFGLFKGNPVLKKAVCQECNEYFGKHLDLALARGSMPGVLRHLRGVKPLSGLASMDQARVSISAQLGGRPEPRQVEFVKTTEGEGVSLMPGMFYVSVSTKEQVFVSLDEMERHCWPNVEDINREQLVQLHSRNDSEHERLLIALARFGFGTEILETVRDAEPGDQVKLTIDVVGDDDLSNRAVAKICFNYFAFSNGAAMSREAIFDDIRGYIRYGKKSSGVGVDRTQPQTMYGDKEEALRRKGHEVKIDLTSKGTEIWGYVALFGVMPYRVRMGAFKGLILPISKGHYFDIQSRTAIEMDVITRPNNMWIP